MPIGDGEEPKSLLTVCKAKESHRVRAKSESTVPSKSENPSRSKGPLTTATPLGSTSTSPEVPRSAPSTKAAKSVVSPHFTRASGRMAQAEGDKALRKFTTITDRIRVQWLQRPIEILVAHPGAIYTDVESAGESTL
nr:uncharacterized protein LOC121501892 [Drosophila kikkawai]